MTNVYFSTELLASCSAKTSGSGLFIPQFDSPIPAPWILTSVSGVQTAVHIAPGSDQFTRSELSKAYSDLPGILFPAIKIEVNPHSSFNATQITGELGSLIFNAGIALVVAKSVGGHDTFDAERIGFDVAPASFTAPTGFRDWRIVVQTDAGTQVLWSRNDAIS